MRNLLYTDRTGAETDDRCGMEYWWTRKENGHGIVPKKQVIHFRIGAESHEDLAAIGEMEDISPAAIDQLIREITDPLTDDDKLHRPTMELLYRRLGWAAAYALYIEPRIREEYENVQIEAELILDRDPLWVAVTPDRVLRHRQNKYLVYREYKTTIQAGQKWIEHWPFDIQIHIGMKAIEEELEEKVAFAQVMGLMKGDNRGEMLTHPYVWAYRNEDTGEWTSDYTKARAKSWHHAPTWDFPGGVVAWVQACGEEVALSQFPHSKPCFLNERMLDLWIERQTARQYQVKQVEAECRVSPKTRAIYFEQRTRNCRPAFGEPCPYLAACWNAAINENPLASGLYEERTPHHVVEIEFLKGNV